MWNKQYLSSKAMFLFIVLILTGCATTALKGISPEGDKAYIGEIPIDNTQAYRQFKQSPRHELDRIHYILNRIKAAEKVEYDRNGKFYSNKEAYEAGIWLVGNSYDKSKDAISFLRDEVWYAKPSLRPHLAKLPDGSVHVAYYLFVNELALLEETIQQ